jgi:hypothetical protein
VLRIDNVVVAGSTVSFKWNTETASKVYSLYQIPSSTCPASASATDVRLITSPASSPNKEGFVSATLNAPATVSVSPSFLSFCPVHVHAAQL